MIKSSFIVIATVVLVFANGIGAYAQEQVKTDAINYAQFYQLSQKRKTKKLEKFILERPALDLNRKNTEGVTALVLAVKRRSHRAVNVLLKAGANPNVRDHVGDTPLLHSLFTWNGEGNEAVIQSLLDAGADINGKNYAGVTPFMKASREYKSKYMKLLAQKGANVHVTDKSGSNARDMFDYARLDKPWIMESHFAQIFDQYNVITKTPYKGYVPYNVDGQRVQIVQKKPPEQAKKVSSRKNIPFVCGKTIFENMTNDQGEAVKYLLEQKRRAFGGGYCIEKITANQKIPLRGNTVIKYRAIFQYPNGYVTNCFNKPKTGDLWPTERSIICMTDSSRRIMSKPGSRTYYNGSDEI